MKKLVVLSMLVFAALLAACSDGVATVPPPEQTQNYQHAVETANAPTAVLSTEVASEEPSAIPPTPESAPTEAVTEQVTEAPIATEAPTEVPTEIPPTEMPPSPTPTATATQVQPSEVPSEVPTETGGVSGTGDQTATSVATDPPAPSATATATASSTLVPTDTATATPTLTNTPVPTDTPTATLTNTATPTHTASNTATVTPSNTPTATLTNTATPTHTASNTATVTPSNTPTATLTNTATPTHTASNTATVTPSNTPTATLTNTATPTFTPTDTYTPTPTLTPSLTPTPTNTPFVPPQEFVPYVDEEIGLSFQYPAVWHKPVYEDELILLSPDGTGDSFPAAIITRGSPQMFMDEIGTDEAITPQQFVEMLAEDYDDVEVTKLSGYAYPGYEVTFTQDDLTLRLMLFVIEDTDWVLLVGAAPSEIFDLYSETTFQQIAVSVVALAIEPTATPIPTMTNTPRPSPTLPATWTPMPSSTPIPPILGETYQDEDDGFGFSYPEGAKVSEDENGVTVIAQSENAAVKLYFVRGRPEALAELGVICESRDPVEALRCVNPDIMPTYTDRYEKFGSPAWFTFQETAGNVVISYVVAAGPEWIFIQLTTPVADFPSANLELFQPILDSVFIEVQPVDIFGRWGLH